MGKKSKDQSQKKKERIAAFHPEFIEDLRYWVETERKVALRAFDLIEAVRRDPFVGIGKPEPLKYLLAGAWSRRLTQEHRIVYLIVKKESIFSKHVIIIKATSNNSWYASANRRAWNNWPACAFQSRSCAQLLREGPGCNPLPHACFLVTRFQ